MLFEFQGLRFIRGASAALPDRLYCGLRDKFKVPIVEAFGMTEALSHCFTNPLYGEQRIGTVGLPDGVEAQIIEGELYIKGPCLFTADWYNTGDQVQQDSAGYYKILGRTKDRINVKGYKLDPNSIENQLYNLMPEMVECAVFGHDKVNCVYVGPYDPVDVKQALKSISNFANPVIIEKLESIPKNGAGKISRSMLIEFYK